MFEPEIFAAMKIITCNFSDFMEIFSSFISLYLFVSLSWTRATFENNSCCNRARTPHTKSWQKHWTWMRAAVEAGGRAMQKSYNVHVRIKFTTHNSLRFYFSQTDYWTKSFRILARNLLFFCEFRLFAQVFSDKFYFSWCGRNLCSCLMSFSTAYFFFFILLHSFLFETNILGWVILVMPDFDGDWMHVVQHLICTKSMNEKKKKIIASAHDPS